MIVTNNSCQRAYATVTNKVNIRKKLREPLIISVVIRYLKVTPCLDVITKESIVLMTRYFICVRNVISHLVSLII